MMDNNATNYSRSNEQVPQIALSGKHSAEELQHQLTAMEIIRLFFVHGTNSYEMSGAREFFSPFEKSFTCTHFSDFTPNPAIEEGIRGAKLFNERKCEAILAVGGGSSIDVAKLVNVYQAHPGKELELSKGLEKLSNQLAPLIAVPTTAGSGSEATHFAVVYVDGVKYSLADQNMLPQITLLNPEFLAGLKGPQLWAPTFDIACQAIESFWAVAATDETRTTAFNALQLVWPIIEAAKAPSVRERSRLFTAANLAGKAINVTKTTAPHALSYTLSSRYGSPHGNAVAVLLRPFFSFNLTMASANLARLVKTDGLKKQMQEIFACLGASNCAEADTIWKAALERCGLPSTLRQVGLSSPNEIDQLVNCVNAERLHNHPVKLNSNTLYYLVKEAFD